MWQKRLELTSLERSAYRTFEFTDTTYCKPCVYCIAVFLLTEWSLEVKQTVGRFERSQPADRHVQQSIADSQPVRDKDLNDGHVCDGKPEKGHSQHFG